MEEEINQIELKTKKLALASKDIDRLSKPGEGCHLQPVSFDEHNLDDDDVSVGSDDSDTDEIFKEAKELQDFQNKQERMRREYISLVLNANRDPVKPGTRCRFKEFQEEVTDGEFDCDTSNLSDGYVSIHRMYENIGPFEDYLKKHDFKEISPNRIFKLTRFEGFQLPVKADSLVIYHCALWIEGSKAPFDSTWMRCTTITSNLATDSLLPGLRELLLTCNKGELCEAFLRPEVAYGQLGVPPRIPPNATIFCFLEVVKVVTCEKLAILTNQSNDDVRRPADFLDYIEASDEARRRGNYYYENQHYKIAMQRYKSAIRLLEGLRCADEKQERCVNELLLKLYNNCARTANAMGNPRLALAACKQASLINNHNPKTYWHRMSAWRKKGHLDRALGMAKRALQLFHDPAVEKPFRRVAEELKIEIQQGEYQETELYRLMGKAWLSHTAAQC